MTNKQPDYIRALDFNTDVSFEKELRHRIDEYFRISGRPSRDSLSMYIKTVIILAVFISSYILLVFAAQNVLQAILLSVILGFGRAVIKINIQHDGGHKAYSDHQWINKIMAMTLDIIGGSSYLWWWKHVRIHHRYVNITGYDTDIEIGTFGRISPYQKRLPVHRWQHIYLWLLYGLIAIKWHLYDDFKSIITGRLHNYRIPRPRGWDLVVFIGGKMTFFPLAFGIPLLFHPWWAVLFCYSIAAVVLGILMSVIFQLPHCVMEADFPLPLKDTGRMDKPWAVHQAEVTLDFSRENRVLTWALGGLNYHREHHLFPIICHINYPAMSKIVKQTCRDFGIANKEHASLAAGMVSHFRWLRKMGKK